MPFGVRVFVRPMRDCSLARWTLSRLSLSFSNCVTVRSLVECSGLQKCSATPDLSTFLLIMSRLCSLNLSFSRLLVAVQSLFYVVVFVSVEKVKRSSTVCDVLACYAGTSRVAFVSASGITGCVTFYFCTKQYIPEVFRSTVAEYGYVGEDFFACFGVTLSFYKNNFIRTRASKLVKS